MDHHHEDYDIPDEILSKLKDYWKEPDIFRFNTIIKEVDKNWVALKTNYFYPEGGGQASDLGVLIPKSDQSVKYNIHEIQSKESETWIKINEHKFSEGDEVNAIIDKDRRISLSRNHSAQHLVSAVFWEELEFDTTRAEIRLEESQIEFNKTPTLDEIHLANSKINLLIKENLPIESKYYEEINSLDQKIRGSMVDLDVYRLVAIGQYDLNPCGGTHVSSTKEIDSIFINKIESKKIRFMTGNDAKELYSQNAINLIRLSRLTNVPFLKIPETVEEIIKKKNFYEKRVHKLESQIIEAQYDINKFHKVGRYYLKAFQIPSMNKGAIFKLIEGLNKNQVVFISDEMELFVLAAGDTEITSNVMKNLLKKGIKGGGKGYSVMGKLGKIKLEDIKNQISDILLN
ncbi:MAG: alanine--tRNA ligase-related protein [Candidatus Kariarchaeaceae archaeon]|jgi:Ser-tRNA(Ala) deacylase AlaX